jgi:hypothetical protein
MQTVLHGSSGEVMSGVYLDERIRAVGLTLRALTDGGGVGRDVMITLARQEGLPGGLLIRQDSRPNGIPWAELTRAASPELFFGPEPDLGYRRPTPENGRLRRRPGAPRIVPPAVTADIPAREPARTPGLYIRTEQDPVAVPCRRPEEATGFVRSRTAWRVRETDPVGTSPRRLEDIVVVAGYAGIGGKGRGLCRRDGDEGRRSAGRSGRRVRRTVRAEGTACRAAADPAGFHEPARGE